METPKNTILKPATVEEMIATALAGRIIVSPHGIGFRIKNFRWERQKPNCEWDACEGPGFEPKRLTGRPWRIEIPIPEVCLNGSINLDALQGDGRCEFLYSDPAYDRYCSHGASCRHSPAKWNSAIEDFYTPPEPEKPKTRVKGFPVVPTRETGKYLIFERPHPFDRIWLADSPSLRGYRGCRFRRPDNGEIDKRIFLSTWAWYDSKTGDFEWNIIRPLSMAHWIAVPAAEVLLEVSDE